MTQAAAAVVALYCASTAAITGASLSDRPQQRNQRGRPQAGTGQSYSVIRRPDGAGRPTPQRQECEALRQRCGKVQRIDIEGDLLDQDVDAIVNAWNRNLFPWWLLLPQGVSGAIKRRAGLDPFRELREYGTLALGDAVLTSAGRLPFKGIIHVAGIGLLWRASPDSVRLSVINAIRLAAREQFASVAFPMIGAGTGGMSTDHVHSVMSEALSSVTFAGKVVLVRYPARP